MESTSIKHPHRSPLEMDCDNALAYVSDHIQDRHLDQVDFSTLRTLSNSAFLDKVSEMMLIPALTECIGVAFYPLLPLLLGRWAGFKEAKVEVIACALGRLIYLEPGYTQELLLQGTSFLRSISHLTLETPQDIRLQQFSAINVDELREYLLAAFRLIIFSRSIFLRFIQPTPLVALLQHPDMSIRYLAIELLCISLGIADPAKEKWTERYLGGPDTPNIAPWEGTTIDYGVLPVLERERIYDAKQNIKNRDYFGKPSERKFSSQDLGQYTMDICGVLVPRFGTNASLPSKLVMTENTKTNLRNIAMTIVAEKPLLLQSVPGAGKSFLIDEIGKLFGRFEDIVRITLTDQTDAKILLGTYVTTTPGSFTWRPGILTTAVKEGKWIVIEDIERAGNDVLSVLLPLLEGRPLEMSGRGEIEMAKGGQIIATTRLVSGTKSAQVVNMLGIQRWSRVTILPPTDTDLLEIITSSLPRIHFIAPVLLQVYTSLRELYDNPTLKSSRKLSPGDLLKWTKRTALLCSTVVDESIPRETWDDIFLEAVDCFAAMIPSLPSRRIIIEKIGTEMGFPPERVRLYIESHAPTLIDESHLVKVGRVTIPKKLGSSRKNTRPFAYTSHAKKLVEQLGVAVLHHESLLLVGETGTGKTTIVQHLADLLHHRLVVVNVSQQTESSDLLGGFKPVDPRTVAVQLKESFETLFERTFSLRRNEAFLSRIVKCYTAQKWPEFVKLLKEAITKAELRFEGPPAADDGAVKKKRRVDGDLKGLWNRLSESVKSFEFQVSSGKGKSHAFSFVEGSLIKALKRGDWLLLDEINLAASDTLESIAGLIREGGSITLPEKGDLEAIKPHPGFRIFACMNPATDVGKRDLPPALRGQFTELYVGSPDESMADLLLIIKQYIGHLCVGDERAASDVAQLYLKIKKAAEGHDIVDGVGQKPHFSIRTLTRTLTYVVDTSGMYGLRRALYEGFCMSFSTMLESASREKVVQAIAESIYPGVSRNLRSALRSLPKRPSQEVVQLGHYWIERGSEPSQENPLYIVKPETSVERNLHNLVRASLTRRYPILLQGPTSSGKTSMIEHLAKLTGHKFLRINNHEHTSLDEYLGTYISTPTGDFVFQEGILVEALRKGHWIVLDELNLAPSDVLEALNRLLDDNRELLIPETQEIITPHPHFMLFATQNPAGLYGGRKVLSRAFRNRFLELEFDDIPEHELEEILCLRCKIPPSYGSKIVEVYKQLSMQRQSTRLFEQRNSFATLRDLFRWAQREAVGYQQLAENGYMLLAERVRRDQERLVVKQVIEKVMKVKIDEKSLYDMSKLDPQWTTESSLIWTNAMRRLFVLVTQALVNNEPILLVGETGCGKTTVCQVLAERMRKELHIINAHQNTETGDIIGGQRPYRDRLHYQSQLVSELRSFFSDRPETGDMTLDDLAEEFAKLDVERLLASSDNPDHVSASIDKIRNTFIRQKILFEWVDGALVRAMKQGEPFLLDEISLADDSVLERLNSVLESSRSIVLAEKGGDDTHITAAGGFQFFATMNPGGDYGKKELSPALRNRFTEIWVPAVEEHDDLVQIVKASLARDIGESEFIVNFAEWFTKRIRGIGATISIRDVLAWVQMVNVMYKSLGISLSLFHGAMMVYVDGIGATSGTEFLDISKEKATCVAYLSELLHHEFTREYASIISSSSTDYQFTLGHFSISKGVHYGPSVPFSFQSPTTAANGMKVLRAMQLPKPILLEGAPGIGKTSLISAIAAAACRHLTRINLSDQTDLMDLFGSDVPVEGGHGGEFAWRDAPFLRAMQNGDWVLLDELNLASQSVLEGLNACLDHRGTAYIPELNRSFARHPDFRIFAAQNPHAQGGGRKGLPKSFVNRFSVVYVDSLTIEDMCVIGCHLFPSIEKETARSLIKFIASVQEEANSNSAFASLGRPWEFNLRDSLRWLELVQDQEGLRNRRSAADYLHLVISQRLRSVNDKKHLASLFEHQVGPLGDLPSTYSLGIDTVQIGLALIRRNNTTVFKGIAPRVTTEQLQTMEILALCVEKGWPCLVVGSSGSGKTSMIRSLASMVGASCKEFSMNSDTDATDIIGGYEQRDLNRQICELINCLRDLLVGLLASTDQPQELSIYTHLLSILSTHSLANYDALALVSQFREFTEGLNLPMNLDVILHRLHDMLIELVEESGTGKFQWYDGILVDALTHGSWIIFDNANLCNPSVLDRLNSLLEPEGSLILHEFTNARGEPRQIKPHPKFRLFLTMDPRHGELSRAMRNRAVEVAVEKKSYETAADESMLDLYLATQSSLRFVGDSLALIRWKFMSASPQHRLKLAEQVPEYTPIQNLPMIQRLFKSFPDTDFSNRIEIQKALEIISELPAAADLIVYSQNAGWDLGVSESFSNSQCLLPVLNDYLPVSFLLQSSPSQIQIARTASIYDLCMRLFEMQKILLNFQVEASLNIRGENRALILAEKQSSKVTNELHKPAFSTLSLMRKISKDLREWILSRSYMTAEDEDFETLEVLLKLWVHMAYMLNEEDLDPSYYSVFRNLLEEWVARIVSPSLSTFVRHVHSELNGLSSSIALSTGMSMSVIWEQGHVMVPSSLERWKVHDRLITIMDNFESKVAFQIDYLSEILAIKLSFQEFLVMLLQSPQQIDIPMQFRMEDLGFVAKSTRDVEFPFPVAFTSLHDLVRIQCGVRSGNELNENLVLMLSHLSGQPIVRSLPPVVLGDNLSKSMQIPLPEEDAFETISGIKLLKQCVNIVNTFENASNKDFKSIHSSVRLFSQLFVRSSHLTTSLCSNKLKEILQENIEQIIDIHEKSTAFPDIVQSLFATLRCEFEHSAHTGGANGISASTSDDIPSPFQYPSNQLRIAIAAIVRSETDMDELSKCWCITEAWVRFTLACISLYVPDKPCDPAATAIVNRRRANFEQVEISTSVETRIEIERQLRGSSQSRRLNIDVQKLEHASHALVGMGNLTVYRPSVSQIGQIQQDLNQLIEITVKSTRLESMLADPMAHRAELQTILNTLEHLATRLQVNYPFYRDFLAFVIAIVSRLNFGIRLRMDIDSARATVSTFSVGALVSIRSLTHPTPPGSPLLARNPMLSSEGVATQLDIWSLEKLAIDASVNGFSPFQNDAATAIFDKCYVRWRISKERQKIEEASKTDIYRRKDEEYELEQAIAEYFPDQPFEASVHNSQFRGSDDEIASKVYDLHRQLFGGSQQSEITINIHQALQRGLKLVASNSNAFSPDEVMMTSFPAHILSLSLNLSRSSLIDPMCYDFYRNPNFKEVALLLEIVSAVQNETRVFLETWSEHATLHDIIALCERIWDLPASSPLSRVLPYVERLYALTDQWQAVASRDYSLSEAHGKTKETIVRWRRLELSSWRTLLAEEERRHREAISSWWFDIYEIANYNLRDVAATDLSNQLIKVIASLNDFITAGTLGDYENRLQLLLSFANHARPERSNYPALERISRACHHLYRLYSLYSSEVQKRFVEQKTALENEIAETVQLASWRDTSVFALTESAKRSHRRLYKTIRKFRDLLSQPVAPILQQGSDLDLNNAAVIVSHSQPSSLSSQDQDIIQQSVMFCEEKKVWSSQSQLFLEPLKLSFSIQNIFRRFVSLPCNLPIAINEFVTNLENLRNQTPSTLTDENEKQVKFLKTQKRRVFAQTMKSLREWGLASKIADQNLTNSVDAQRMQSTLTWRESATNSIQSKIDERFYDIVDLLPRMRAAGSEHSPDLSDAEFHRAHGYLESLVDGIFEQRNTLIRFDQQVNSIKTRVANTISVLTSHMKSTNNPQFLISPAATSYIESRRDIIRRLNAVFGICISVLESHKNLDSQANIAGSISHLDALQQRCHRCLVQVDELVYNDNILFGNALEWTSGADELLGQIHHEIFKRSIDFPEFLYVFKPIEETISGAKDFERLFVTEVTDIKADVQAFQRASETLGAATLVATQEISKFVDKAEVVSANYSHMKAFLSTSVTQLHFSTFMKKINSLHELSIPLLSSRQGLHHVLAVFNSLLPVLERYIDGCEQVGHYFLRYHHDFSQMTHVLMIAFYNLATKGYCSPQRSEKERGTTQSDGVGLGEGEGETDISNEIKDNEDLTDLAGQDKTENNESKGDGDENGVEMEDDFNGALEDGPEGDEEEEEGDDEDDEMEEGTGAVDDTDPSAVDEQFWEDQAKQPPDTGDEKQTQGKKELEDQKGELGANNKDRELKDKNANQKEEEEGQSHELTEEDAESEMDDSSIQNREDSAIIPEAEPLDLADDLDLNQPDGQGKEENIFSDDEMDLESHKGEDVDEREEIISDNDIEESGEQDMDVDQDGEVDKDENDEGLDNINNQNVDQSEYQGDDIVASEAFGKGGQVSSMEEKHQGANDDELQQDQVDSADQLASNPNDSANGQGEAQSQSRVTQEDISGEQSQRDESKSSNPYRKLGDMLEQWRRDLQNVRDISSKEENEQKTVGEQNPEFSYVGEEEDFNNQALGPAAPDQVQPLDMSMAIDEEEPQRPKEQNPTENDPSEFQSQTMDVNTTLHPASFGASIGDRSRDPDRMDIDQLHASSLDEPLFTEHNPSDVHDTLTVSAEVTEESRLLWQQHDRSTHDLSLSLCEQLRLILEPTQATKMRGDFRTGKRLNMRRIIPYIASDYKKDKIWMRRTKPSKRQYQVMIAMDDSKSMSDSKSVKLAFDTLALTAKALTQLEVGQIGIVRFGEDVKVVHGFEEQFTSESGGKVVQQFQFDQSRTDVCALTKRSIDLFNVARLQQNIRSSMGDELWQLELIISDGICEDHDTIRRAVREAFEAKILMIFVILDAIHPERKDSILDIKSYSFETGEGGQVLKETRYLDSFPFNYFVIVRDVRELPSVLASALRQWFAEVAEK